MAARLLVRAVMPFLAIGPSRLLKYSTCKFWIKR